MSLPKPTIRSSSLPLFMACNPAVLNPDKLPSVEQENEPALVGTLVHGVCESLVKTGSVEMEPLRQRLSPEDFDRASLLFNNFLDVWKEARRYMTDPQTEVYHETDLSHVRLTGNIDCVHFDPGRAFVLDYKTGRQHEDHFHQMAAYAYLAWDKAGRPAKYVVYVTTVYLEDKSVVPYTFTAEQLVEWEAEIAKQVMNTRYTVGRKCATCSLQGGCPAYKLYASNAIASMVDLHESEYRDLPTWENLDPEDRGNLIDQMYVVDKALDRLRLSLRNAVKSRGALDIGNGKEQTLVEQEERQVNLSKALPILLESVGQGTVISNSHVTLESMLAARAARAPKGGKMKAREALLKQLDKAGAIVRTKTTKMFRRPKGEKVMEENA